MSTPSPVRRFGQVIGLDPACLEAYARHHAEFWPDVADVLHAAHVRNYSIYYREGMLFGYFEYTGTDFDRDMAAVAAHPRVKEWWAIMGPMQRPLPDRQPGEWWLTMREVFHME